MAIRSLKRSSMRLALGADRGGKTRFVFSAGNTCSYMGLAKIILKTLPGVCVCVGGGGNLTRGNIDVSVTDVFTGNVALKTGEGVIRLIFDALKWGFSSSWRGKLEYLITKLIFESLKCQLDLQKYNGACWIGLNGMAVKSHGKLIPWNLPINYLFSQLAQFTIKVSKSPDSQLKVLHLVLVAISPALFWFLEVLSDEK
ncbi:hypothetical protein DAPPUDRAFT_117277 [Daphnia pulex]|uniref:phosphate acyltransferase n=1 Tax=Daphnia pulex TaxID=6669 RepID=E9HS40_DAPPU|nr:hypothetical protein DAPPUDRAFT_117277 [Daphnia pulex]|eukprot:EFX65453.1 hypothetical protein DAPPUDRAFT_117277 [Daphnia pulex]